MISNLLSIGWIHMLCVLVGVTLSKLANFNLRMSPIKLFKTIHQVQIIIILYIVQQLLEYIFTLDLFFSLSNVLSNYLLKLNVLT